MDNDEFFKATVPSNIAFLKYWGKKDEAHQWAANNSISMTLSHCVTETIAHKIDAEDHKFYFNDTFMSREHSFAQKTYQHLDRISEQLGTEQKLLIKSKNHFPSGCGIASSASGMGALTLASLAALKNSKTFADLNNSGYSKRTLSQLARLGSGSSCRSFWGGFVKWDIGPSYDHQKTDQVFDQNHWELWDIIILFSTQEKSISSSKAHLSAWTSPIFEKRLAEIKKKEETFLEAITSKDIELFGRLLEDEALEMHEVMQTSTPPARYLLQESHDFISWLQRTRETHNIKAYFTIDAGPNIHIICEGEHKDALLEKLALDLPHVSYLVDKVGQGPSLEVYNERT